MSDGDVELRIDSLREVLDVAVDVLRDYGDSPGETRIERMARWIILNLGVEVQEAHAGICSQAVTSKDIRVSRAGQDIASQVFNRLLQADDARAWAKALLICAERSEQD